MHQEFVGSVVLLYVKGVMDRIGRLLSRHGVCAIYKVAKEIQQFLRPVKDARDPLPTYGVYCVSCSGAQVYISTTEHSVQTTMGEHSRCCHLHQPEKSTVAKHAFYNTDN